MRYFLWFPLFKIKKIKLFELFTFSDQDEFIFSRRHFFTLMTFIFIFKAKLFHSFSLALFQFRLAPFQKSTSTPFYQKAHGNPLLQKINHSDFYQPLPYYL